MQKANTMLVVTGEVFPTGFEGTLWAAGLTHRKGEVLSFLVLSLRIRMM